MQKLDGGMVKADGLPVYYTPGVLMDLACIAAGLAGAEFAAFQLCKIHAYGAPRWEKKSAHPHLSRAFIATHCGVSRSTGYEAVDSLVARRCLYINAAGGLCINKWINEWLDKDGKPLFDPETRAGQERLSMILDSLTRSEWWQLPAAIIGKMLPQKARRNAPSLFRESETQESCQSGTPDNQHTELSGTPDTYLRDMSGQPDKNGGDLSGTPDKNSGKPDNRRPQTPENAASEAPGEGDLRDLKLPFQETGLSAEFAACPRGDEVCAELGSNIAAKFPRTSWLTALDAFSRVLHPDSLKSPTAFVLAVASQPGKADTLPGLAPRPGAAQPGHKGSSRTATATAALETVQGAFTPQKSGRQDSASRKERELADAFAQRPSAIKIGATRELRESRVFAVYAAQLDRWITAGCPEVGRPLAAMAAGEEAARKHFSAPERRGA